MNHFAAFTGINGFGIAAEWAGFETIGFSEIEPYCCALLAEKWPEIPNYGDIRDTARFTDLRGQVDVLSAGVPCQPASLAGKRRGEKDDRWLWSATLDVVGLVRPTWCIFENPLGIVSLGEFGGVLSRLASLGYEVRLFCVSANSIGAKHRRERVFIVANARREHGDIRGCKRERSLTEWSCIASARSSEDSESVAHPYPERELQQGGIIGEFREWAGNGSEQSQTLASPKSTGREGSRNGVRTEAPFTEPRRALQGHVWLQADPRIYRGFDGIRNRAYRLKGLGNAVVPQQAFPFFEAIAKVEKLEHFVIRGMPST